MSLSYKGFPGWMSRAALPFGFAIAVTAGSALLMHGAVSVTEMAPESVAQVVLPPPAAMPAPAAHGGHPAPNYVRAIESDAVYTPQKIEKVVSNHRDASLAALPAGVERFDQCSGTCETRDPMIVHTAYDAPPAADPAPARSQEDNTLFSLPKWADGAALVDRATQATASAATSVVDTAKQAVTGVTDFAAGLVR